MDLRAVQFLSLVFTAIAMAGAFAHLLELPNKAQLVTRPLSHHAAIVSGVGAPRDRRPGRAAFHVGHGPHGTPPGAGIHFDLGRPLLHRRHADRFLGVHLSPSTAN